MTIFHKVFVFLQGNNTKDNDRYSTNNYKSKTFSEMGWR